MVEGSPKPAFVSPTPPEASRRRAIENARQRAALAKEASAAKRPLLVNVPYLDTPRPLSTTNRPVRATIYEAGVRVHWPVKAAKPASGPNAARRGCIGDMSSKARIRCCFSFGNAPHPWAWMITLTFREQPKQPKRIFDKFTRLLRRTYNMRCQWAWVMEYQARGVVHYHLFLGTDCVGLNRLADSASFRRVVRGRNQTSIVDGPFADWVCDAWIGAVGDASPEFERFQKGGLVELLRSPDAAARYVAKETGKKHQKALPAGIEGGQRWWWISEEGKPKPVAYTRLSHWPFVDSLGTVFDRAALIDYFQEIRWADQTGR